MRPADLPDAAINAAANAMSAHRCCCGEQHVRAAFFPDARRAIEAALPHLEAAIRADDDKLAHPDHDEGRTMTEAQSQRVSLGPCRVCGLNVVYTVGRPEQESRITADGPIHASCVPSSPTTENTDG